MNEEMKRKEAARERRAEHEEEMAEDELYGDE